MLLEFSLSNFRSFRDEQTLTMLSNKRLKRVPGWVVPTSSPACGNASVLTGALIYGANASGKSSFIRALSFVANYVERGAQARRPNAGTGRISFRLDDVSVGKPTKFEIKFCHKGLRFDYEVALDSLRILSEKLWVSNGDDVGELTRKYKKSGSYLWTQSGLLANLDVTVREKTRDNILFLPIAADFNQSIPKIAYDWFAEYLQVLDLQADRPGIPHAFTASMSKENSNFQKRVVQLMRNADLGIVDFSVSEHTSKRSPGIFGADLPPEVAEFFLTTMAEQERFRVAFIHRGAEGMRNAPTIGLQSQSAGTQRLFALAGPVLDVLENGYTLIVDEIDASMHPALVRQLLCLFSSPEINKNGAQLICTTHDVTLLDRDWLRRDQIWFCEKSNDGRSQIYSLDDFPVIKNESYEKGYLSGKYRAVPRIPKLLSSLPAKTDIRDTD